MERSEFLQKHTSTCISASARPYYVLEYEYIIISFVLHANYPTSNPMTAELGHNYNTTIGISTNTRYNKLDLVGMNRG
jgi:hypothetical protein